MKKLSAWWGWTVIKLKMPIGPSGWTPQTHLKHMRARQKLDPSYPTNRGENTTESMKMVETVQPTAVFISAMIPKNNGKTHAAKKSTQKKTWKPLVGVVGDFVPNGSSENFVVFRIHLSAESLSWNMPGVCRISVQHPGKLTWNPEMEVWKMIFLSKWVSLMFQLLIQGWRLSACHFLVEGVGI